MRWPWSSDHPRASFYGEIPGPEKYAHQQIENRFTMMSQNLEELYKRTELLQHKDMRLESGGTIPIEYVVRVLAQAQGISMTVGPVEDNS